MSARTFWLATMMVRMIGLRLIGYWQVVGDSSSCYPDPREWVDVDWDDDERHATWFYFTSGTLFRTFMGYSPCRFCGANNGASEFTDGTYVWPEGLGHYLYDHGVRLPDEVVRHARGRLDALEAQDIDTTWWEELRRET